MLAQTFTGASLTGRGQGAPAAASCLAAAGRETDRQKLSGNFELRETFSTKEYKIIKGLDALGAGAL